jgi:hypothetical protein
MDKIKNQLAGVAALLGVIAAIGGGFVKYGEVMTKLEILEGASKGIDMSFLSEIKVLEEKVNKLCFGVDNKELAKYIKNNLIFDQLILEFYTPSDPSSGWVHCSYSKEENRKETLLYDGKEYTQWIT